MVSQRRVHDPELPRSDTTGRHGRSTFIKAGGSWAMARCIEVYRPPSPATPAGHTDYADPSHSLAHNV